MPAHAPLSKSADVVPSTCPAPHSPRLPPLLRLSCVAATLSTEPATAYISTLRLLERQSCNAQGRFADHGVRRQHYNQGAMAPIRTGEVTSVWCRQFGASMRIRARAVRAATSDAIWRARRPNFASHRDCWRAESRDLSHPDPRRMTDQLELCVHDRAYPLFGARASIGR